MDHPLLLRAISAVGIVALVGLAWLLGDRRGMPWRPLVYGLALQLLLAVVLLNPALRSTLFDPVNDAVVTLLGFSDRGAEFLFGAFQPHGVLDAQGKPLAVHHGISPPLRTFAFQVLPTIIFFSSLMSVLYHVGVMQRVVWLVAAVMQRTLRTSGAESLAAAANIFLGQTEAPLLVRPFIEQMTRSELNAVMVGGFASASGGVLAMYVSFLQGLPGIAGHLVVASVLSAPASLAIAKVMVPETETPKTATTLELNNERPHGNVIEAAAAGASDGLTLALNVAAVLVAFVALTALLNHLLGLVPFPGGPLDLSRILGWLFAPIAFLMGVRWQDCGVVGQLLGEKIVLTELVAYGHLGERIATHALDQRSAIITSYALCGFANFASIGIQIGGLAALAPSRRGDVAKLGVTAMIAGSISSFTTACFAGILL